MKLCLVQNDIVWENKAANREKAAVFLSQAAEQGAQLVVFPEMSLTGFSMNVSLAEPPNGDTVEFFADRTRELGIAAGFGFSCIHDGIITNRFCIAYNGEIVAAYDKIHPFSYGGENLTYTAGNCPVIAEVCAERIGLTVCYDLRFPELYQKLSENCSVILTIANWPDTRSVHWNTLLKARAIENQCYVAGCNRCGSAGGLSYSGESAVYSPEGEVVCAAGSYKEQMIYAEVSREICAAVRGSFPLKKDRRCDLYRDFYVK